MIKKTNNIVRVNFVVEFTKKEYDALISISGGNVEKMTIGYLKELAAGKKKIKNFKGRCHFCDREMTIYTDGYKIFINSVRT